MPRPLALVLLTTLALLGLAQTMSTVGAQPTRSPTQTPTQAGLYLPALPNDAPPTATATATSEPTATREPTPTQTVQPSPTSTTLAPNCHPSYPTVCIPPPPPDLDCGDIPYRRFTVIGSDPHRFDTDDDGIGCEGR